MLDEDFDPIFERVKSDAGLRAVLKAARTWGVSPRRFMGWEPQVTYGHVYESGTGKLMRTVVTTEPEWDDETRSLAMAFAMYEADLCPGCNQPMSETTKAEHDGAYVAGQAVRCHFCTVNHMASDMYSDAPQSQALFIPVHLRSTDGTTGAGDGGGRPEESVTEDS